MTQIHSTAIVDKKADLGENVTVGPFTIIEGDVVIGEGTQIGSHCYIDNGTRIIAGTLGCMMPPYEDKALGQSSFDSPGDANGPGCLGCK